MDKFALCIDTLIKYTEDQTYVPSWTGNEGKEKKIIKGYPS